MLFEFLVRNYYENNGNFKGIHLTAIGNWLQEQAKDLSITIEELCYRILGYSYNADVSASDMSSMRAQVVSLLYEKNKKEAAVPSKRIQEVSSDYKSPAVDRYITYEEGSPANEIFELCYAYYCNCFHGYVSCGKHTLEFAKFISFFRANPQSFRSMYKSLEENGNTLIYNYSARGGNYIYNDVLTTKILLTDDEFESINKAAFKRALVGKTLDLSKYTKFYDELSTLSISRPAVYLELLDLANGLGITYKDLLAEVGINIINQMEVYEDRGFAVIDMDDKNMGIVITKDNTLENPFLRKVII